MIYREDLAKKFSDAAAFIKDARNIVLIPHHNADGDAVGSSVGLVNLLGNCDKKVKVVCPNRYPDFLMWMKGSKEVVFADEKYKVAQELIASSDLIIMTDFNGLDRIDSLKDLVGQSTAKKILIDHHPYPENIADIMFSDTTVSSTAELVYEFVLGTELQHCMDKAVAECLYAGILTDTGSFSFNSSNPRTFVIVAELLSYGVNKNQIFADIFDNFSNNRFRLLGHALKDKMVILPEYNTGYISLTAKELDSFNFVPGDIEGFVNYPLSIKGIVFSAIFVEKVNNTKISFRSKGNFPANKVMSTHFVGGGHMNAAGGKSRLNLNDTIEKFVKLLPEFKSQLNEGS